MLVVKLVIYFDVGSQRGGWYFYLPRMVVVDVHLVFAVHGIKLKEGTLYQNGIDNSFVLTEFGMCF